MKYKLILSLVAIVGADEAANGLSNITAETIVDYDGVTADVELYQIAMEHCATELEKIDRPAPEVHRIEVE